MKTYLDWSAYRDAGMGDAYADIPKHGGDFAKAVAACINSRACERSAKQVMCPSYRVSGNPNLSTGGRVRLLKRALSSGELADAVDDDELAEAMSLCVGCKGCKRECEASVDMAAAKNEYLAHRVATKGLDLRGRLFAGLPRWLHNHRWLRPVIRWRNRSPLLRRLGQRYLGLAARVPLPEPASERITVSSGNSPVTRDGLPEVVLFADTFTREFEPDILRAAQQVLRSGGYHAQVLKLDGDSRPPCCGRTYLAQGLVGQARAEAERLMRALQPHVAAGRFVVGLEASCVLGLRDDAQALGIDKTLSAAGKSVMLFEEFLAREAMAKRLHLPLLEADSQRLLVHGHCHQKAVGAMKSVRKVLKLIPALDFEMIDAGCCGMAGTFGLESEHADMATAMAEQGLLPTLREQPGADVMANGFSCRHQIRTTADRRPRHLAEIILEHLDHQAAGHGVTSRARRDE